MKWGWGFITAFLIVSQFLAQTVGAVSPSPSLTPNRTIAERWAQEKSGISTWTDETHSTLVEKQVVFFGGILNELASITSSYFTSSIEMVDELGISYSYYGPASYLSPTENIGYLYTEIIESYQRNGKPIVLVGHSKGALESLYTVLSYPELMTGGIVDRVVLIQAPMGGSPIADPEAYNLPMKGLSKFLGPGLKALEPARTRQKNRVMHDLFLTKMTSSYGWQGTEEVQRRIQELSRRIFYIRAMKEYKAPSLGLQIALTFAWDSLDSLGLNDGLILLNDQYDPQFGIDLGAVSGDHLTLVIGGIFSNGDPADQKALTRAILAQVYE